MFSLRNFDWLNFLVLILILSLGTITILSVNPQLFANQLVYAIISILVYLIISSLDFRIFEGLANFFYLLTIFILMTPIFVGVFSRGAVRWIQIGGITFQPSEFAKPMLIIFFAKFWLSQKFNFKNLIVFLILLSVPVFLIFYQPDLGSSLVVLSFALGMLFMTQVTGKQIVLLTLIFIFVIPFGWFLLKNYQRQRIEHFLNPWKDPLGAGYNLIQAQITIGSGGFKGKGFGKGTQSHLAFLPERHTDFVFASFAEEFGFIGSASLLFLYFLVLKKILLVGSQSQDKFTAFLASGIFSFLLFQIIVNVGMNIGLLPITGITLPLFSYGGSSLMSTMVCLGLVESIFETSQKKAVIEIGAR